MDQDKLKEWIHRYELANFIVERRMHARMRGLMPDELTVEQFKTLRYLRHNNSSTMSELSEYFCVGKSSITAIITRLTDKRLIDRFSDEKDRRVIQLKLTEEGARLCDLMSDQVQLVLQGILEDFDENQIIEFIESFEYLAEKVKDL